MRAALALALCWPLAGCLGTMAAATGYMGGGSYSPPSASTAWATGRQQIGTSVTGKTATTCEYAYGSQRFARTFEGYSCPTSVIAR